jgi:predicted Zn-dependent peptidase
MPVELGSEKRLDVEADVELARLSITWPTPPAFAPGDAELDGVGAVLASGKSSRLYKKLVYDLQIAQDVSAFQGSALLGSTFDITVTLKPGKSASQALAIVDTELAKLRAQPPSDDEVQRFRASQVAHMMLALESVTARANQFNEYNQGTGDPGYLEKDVARYERLGPTDIQQAAAAYLPPGRRVVTVVTPKKGAPRAGRLVGGAS